MAAAKKQAKAKTFPKIQAEEGAPDRFIPPDRADQRFGTDDDERPQMVDLAADIEIVEDNTPRERGGDEDRGAEVDDEPSTRRPRQQARDDADRGDEDEDGDGRERHSRKVRARINRERALRQQAEAKVSNAERRAKAMEERVTKLERVTTEVQESTGVKQLEAKIAQLEKEAKTALEAEDHKKAFDLQAELGDAKADLKLLKRDLENGRRQQIADEQRRTAENEAAGGETTETGGKKLSATTQDWMSANRNWYGRERYKDARTDAGQLDTELLEEIAAGDHDFEKYSDEHFELLNERLAELYPELPIYNTDGSKFEAGEEDDTVDDRDRGGDRRDGRRSNTRQTNGRRAPMNGRGTGSRSGRTQKSEADLAREGKIILNEDDFAQMRLYGLDPQNPDQKKRFAKERMRTILTDERRNGRGARS